MNFSWIVSLSLIVGFAIDKPMFESRAELDQALRKYSTELGSPVLDVRRNAAKEIYEICREYKSRTSVAIPTLLEALGDKDEKVQESVQWALSYCEEPAIEGILTKLADSDAAIRLAAVTTLTHHIGEDFRKEVEDKILSRLSAALSDTSSEVRSKAALAISLRPKVEDHRILGRLQELATAAESADRASGLHALANISDSLSDKVVTRSWKTAAERGLVDLDAEVRKSAVNLLACIDISALDKLGPVSRALQDQDSDVAWAALRAGKSLAESGAEMSAFIAPLQMLVPRKSPNNANDRDAAELLGIIGPPAKAAVPVLLTALDSDDPFMVCEAAEALWKIDMRTKELLPALRRILKSQPREGRGEAVCDVIYGIGPAAAELAPDVVQLLAIPDADLQWAASDALGALGVSDPLVVNALLEALSHRSGIVRSAAATALEKCGPEAIPLLIKALDLEPKKSSSLLSRLSRLATGEPLAEDPREWIADLLGRMGADGKDSLPAMRKLLKHDNRNLRLWTAIAIGKIDGSADVVPQLIEVLKTEPGDHIRRSSLDAICTIGPAAKDALPVLRKIAADAEDDLQDSAKDAILRIERR